VYLLGIFGILYLLLTSVFGYSLLKALKLPLKDLELAVASTIVGVIIATWISLLPALLLKSLDTGIIVSALVMLGTVLWIRPPLPSIEKEHLVPVAVIALFSLVLMYLGLFWYFDGAYHAAFPLYGDAAFHASVINSFAQGFNFPPQYPMMAGRGMGYTFLMDYYTAGLERLGLGLEWSIVLSGWLLLSGLLSLLYFMGVRFTKRRAGGILAVVLLVFSGGVGFLYAISDWRASGLSLWQFLTTQNLNYTCNYTLNLVYTNFVIIVMAQRTALIGFAVGIFAILLVYAMLVQREFDDRAMKNGLLLTGVLTGLLPLFHEYSYVCILCPVALLLLIFREKKWYYFFAPAVLLAIPQALYISEQTDDSFIRVQIGWMAGTIANIPYFWLENLGFAIVLIVAGFYLISRDNRKFYLPFLAIFVVANLIIFQPWDYDNHKFFSFWAMPTALLMAAALLFVYDLPKLGKPLFAIFLVLTTLTGALVIVFLVGQPYVEIGSDYVHVGDWISQNTPPNAVFLTSDSAVSPVTTVAGRMSYLGYDGWLSTYGINFTTRDNIRSELYSVSDPNDEMHLLKENGIGYVLIGPSEMSSDEFTVNESYFDQNLVCVFNWTDPQYGGNFRIYQV
jgi:hypothetical protein